MQSRSVGRILDFILTVLMFNGGVISIDMFYLCLSNQEEMIIEAINLRCQETEEQHLASDDLCKESRYLCHSHVYLSLERPSLSKNDSADLTHRNHTPFCLFLYCLTWFSF